MKHIQSSAFSVPIAPRAHRSAGGTASTVFGWPRRILATLVTWQARADGRRHLSELDDRLLADMGVSRAEADRESRKPFWIA